MLFVGVSNGDWGGIGNIAAYDPTDGHVIWRWETVPGPGQPGHSSWAGDSWKRGGGAIWSGIAIDPATSTLYADAGNPQPDFLGTIRKGANLYSNSMVALDISGATPKLKWYHQFIPHDTHDWDPAMPPVLFSGTVNGGSRSLVAAGDKGGNFWVLDAGTAAVGINNKGTVVVQYAAGFAPGMVTAGFLRHADGTILSMMNEVSTLAATQAACARLRTMNLPLLGAVLNGARVKAPLGY